MSDSGSDHEHWPQDFAMRTASATLAGAYDDHNGLHAQTYVPIERAEDATPPASPPMIEMPQQRENMLTSVQMQTQPAAYCYDDYQYIASPTAPAAPLHIVPVTAGVSYTYHPAGIAVQPNNMAPHTWIGRTKDEVNEDNKRIATAEKAYDKRAVMPVGLGDDQMCWVIEVDGSHTLRTFVAIKDLKGLWKQDPRYDESWYFVMDKEEAKKKPTAK